MDRFDDRNSRLGMINFALIEGNCPCAERGDGRDGIHGNRFLEELEVKRFLLSTYHADGPPPPSVDIVQVVQDVEAFESELKQAGAWVFAAHLHPSNSTTVVRIVDGERYITDGPYVEGDEHAGGITVLQALDLNAALAWAGKLAAATTLPIEVRPFMTVTEDLN